ncbi:MAG: NAD+ synthase [Actinomycetota bacterium]|nr:NAD+ synthase [Actinomycetota bacterium]
MPSLTIAACQMNPLVGDIEGNVDKMLAMTELAKTRGASLVVFPELAVSGYPPEDLLAKSSYLRKCGSELERLALQIHGITAIVGTPESNRGLFNSAAVIDEGRIVRYVRKEILPNYLVFDEKRYFNGGIGPSIIFEKDNVRFGVSICEDAWFADGPVSKLAAYGAEVVININASPYSIGKRQDRAAMLKDRSSKNGVFIVYVNQVGGQDELVFDGASMAYSPDGELVALAESFLEEILYIELEIAETRPAVEKLDISAVASRLEDSTSAERFEFVELSSGDNDGFEEGLFRTGGFIPFGSLVREPDPREFANSFVPKTWSKTPFVPLSESIEESMVIETYQALEVGTRDYVSKNGFDAIVLGLSGGIDSALVAVVASDALGPDKVHCVGMPSMYSSEGSLTDAKQLVSNLGAEFLMLPIETVHQAFLDASEHVLGRRFEGLTDENLQSRLRGVYLMALSNQRNWLVLTTGNKSEMATGYSTLYGDTAGGFGVIKDLSKTMVYRLSRFRNQLAGREVIPEAILEKAPSAELRPDQRDVDSLPPYEILDPIVEALVELDYDTLDLIDAGFDSDTVVKIARLIDLNEYKRRQSPPGVRVTQRAFGKDRRVPITNGFKPWKTVN